MDKVTKTTINDFKKLYRPTFGVGKGGNGQVTVIGGSSLFHGAPILGLKTASRIVDMVYFSSHESSLGKVAEKLKSQLCSFIWVPWEETEEYLKKSDAILIGPGMMRNETTKIKDEKSPSKIKNLKEIKTIKDEGLKTYLITEYLLKKYPEKRWVIDAGALQMMETDWIPKRAILTPNQKEFKRLFRVEPSFEAAKTLAKQYQCLIALKGTTKTPHVFVCSPKKQALIESGNAGLTKGGTGDVLAGLTVALAAKNELFLSSFTAAWIVKLAADSLYERAGFAYNADDLAEEIPKVLGEYFR